MIRPAVRITSLAVAGILLILYVNEENEPGAVAPSGHATPAATSFSGSAGADWFAGVRQHCNGVEVETTFRRSPPPSSLEGQGFAAACLALAGKIELARARIAEAPEADRWRAAGIVFDVGHPVADAGDDVSAAPIMELVVEFWPNHYMALYHAGAARAALGDHDSARPYLEDFLRYYEVRDGWTRAAERMLGEGKASEAR